MSGQVSPYPGEAPPSPPVPLPLDLYIAEREADRHAWEQARTEDRAWMASIARDVKTLLAAHHQSAGAATAEARHVARGWSLRLAILAAGLSIVSGSAASLIVIVVT